MGMCEKDQIICLLKSEIQDLEDQLADKTLPSIECLDTLDLREIKIRVVKEAINRTNTQKEAADLLGLDRTSVHRFMLSNNIKSPDKWHLNKMAHLESHARYALRF